MATTKARANISTPTDVRECTYESLADAIWWLDPFQYKHETRLGEVSMAITLVGAAMDSSQATHVARITLAKRSRTATVRIGGAL